MSELPRFRDPRLSLWQSSVSEILHRDFGSDADTTIDHEIMRAASFAALPFAGLNSETALRSVPSPPLPVEFRQAAGILPESFSGEHLKLCADLYLRLALAGNVVERAKILSEFSYGTCDWNWTKVLAVYAKYVRFHQRPVPYLPPSDPDDMQSVFSDLPERATVGFLADWGTGTTQSVELLRKLLGHRKPGVPFFLIHLGDIYYSGTYAEVKRFAEICRAELNDDEPVFTLAGNHDMYAGGAPYYSLIGGLNEPPYTQRTSYFVLRNKFWQLQAMDTGLNDRNPLNIDSVITQLDPREADWHRARLNEAGDRKVILLSHHQPFSPFENIGEGYINENLLSTFNNYDMAAWLWGHEHNLALYKPYRGIEKGRCIGSGAIPVRLEEAPYNVQFPEIEFDQNAKLDHDGTLYGHAYAVMEIDGPSGSMAYYQDPDPNSRNPLGVDRWS